MTTHSQNNIWNNNALRISVIFLSLCNFSFAQDTLKTIPKPFPLEELKGYTQTFYYSKGSEERAKSIALFIENAGAYFQKEIGFTPKAKVYILAPQHWKDFAAKPLWDVYGFPHNVDDGRLVIAAEDNDFWRSFLPPVDKLPAPIARQVTNAYGKPDGSYSMMPFFDLLALHELGHSYTAQARLKMHRYSMGELFVNIMLHTYVAEKQIELLPALEAFPNMVVAAGTAEYKYTSLNDFERLYPTLGMGPKNYGWYQCKLHSAAKDIYNSGGKSVLTKLWKALEKHQEEMTDKEFISMLNKEVHPSVANVYLEWNKVD
ncbi:MAG TPA: hypothetical protein PLJ60_05300 [Chryseolinea sp.]|nr:hypothetical protein [Chryseolinea sp.]HPH45711.1 hypothetical protein [Chryseolinea sp.]HPM29735.1 hypothetical protein [Chryseolinea sp.]